MSPAADGPSPSPAEPSNSLPIRLGRADPCKWHGSECNHNKNSDSDRPTRDSRRRCNDDSSSQAEGPRPEPGPAHAAVGQCAGPCPVFLNRASVPPKCDRHFLGYLQRKLWHLDICFGGNVVTYESAFWHGKDILARRCNFKFASCAKSGCGQSELFQMYGLDGYGFWTKTAVPSMQQIKFAENEE